MSASVIAALKSVFSRYGSPEILWTDNGPQYSSDEFARFAKALDICNVTSSPHYPQSNGQAERMVQTMKRLLQRSANPFLAVLSYRATLLPWCNLSPAELLMGRCLRTTVPQTDGQLIPKWPFLPEFKRLNRDFKDRQKRDFDRRHRVQELPPIPEDKAVWVQTERESIPGTVVLSAPAPRSYIVGTPTGEVHRNRSHLRVVPEDPQSQEPTQRETDTQSDQPSRITTRSRTGVKLKPPDRLA